jgi:hypothetical protein
MIFYQIPHSFLPLFPHRSGLFGTIITFKIVELHILLIITFYAQIKKTKPPIVEPKDSDYYYMRVSPYQRISLRYIHGTGRTP